MYRKSTRSNAQRRTRGAAKKASDNSRNTGGRTTRGKGSKPQKENAEKVRVVVQDDSAMGSPKAFDRFNRKPQHGGKYAKEVFRSLRENESYERADPEYLDRQKYVTALMRERLVDWIIDVSTKFQLQDETMHLTVNIVDRYLSRRTVERENFQLIGAAAMFIAAKYEEIYFPALEDLEQLCAFAYRQRDILKAEKMILSSLGYKLTTVTPVHYINEMLYCYKNPTVKQRRRLRCVVKMLMDLSTQKYKVLKCKPSVVAAGCAYLGGKLVLGPEFTYDDEFFKYYTGVEAKMACRVARFLYENLTMCFRKSCKLTGVVRKYQKQSRMKTSVYLKKIISFNNKPQ